MNLDNLNQKNKEKKIEKFDCIFSNKVIMHLSKEDMMTSLMKQKELLTENKGILCHSLWFDKDSKEELLEKQKIFTQYYNETDILEFAKKLDMEILGIFKYKEMETNDSIAFVFTNNKTEAIIPQF